MERAEVYLTKFGKLRIDSFFDKKNENYDYRFDDKRAEQFIEELSRESIRYAQEDGDNLIVTYNGLKLIINECMDILSNIKYRELFAPILLKIKHQEERRRVKELKNKKVVRKNKHIKSRIIASGLTLVTISGILIGISKKNEKVKTDNYIPTTYTQLSDEYNEVKDHFINVSKNAFNEEKAVPPEEKSFSLDEDNVVCVSINYNDRTNTTKAINAKLNYKNLIDKYSKMYGLDSNLMLALATQERGIHSEKRDSGGATGLMQIQNSVWAGKSLKAYNFEKKQYEKIIVDSKKLSDLEYNIKVGCMIYQENLRYMNYNPLLALQSYNMGYGNMDKVLKNYYLDSKKNKTDVLNNFNDTDWMNCRNIIEVGDKSYIENVLSYCGNSIKIVNTKPDGTKVVVNVDNKENKKIY